jgi:hypothetical protein
MSEPLLPVLHENDDFILAVENTCPDHVCDNLIELYKTYDQRGSSYTRETTHPNATKLLIEDRSLTLEAMGPLDIRNSSMEFDNYFWANCYAPYAAKYPILKECGAHKVFQLKLQHTRPGQGYHAWHAETMTRELSTRVLTFILYLNDVEEGGETEFLYQHRRVKPKKGTCVLWPAAFTHVHRGNPPLKGDKYVLTGWVEF